MPRIRLMAALLVIAAAPAGAQAEPAARMASVRVLIFQLTVDRYVTYGDLTQSKVAWGCPLGSVNDRGAPILLTPLPADAAARAGAVASTIAENPREPEVVRIAADCITQAIRQHSLWQR